MGTVIRVKDNALQYLCDDRPVVLTPDPLRPPRILTAETMSHQRIHQSVGHDAPTAGQRHRCAVAQVGASAAAQQIGGHIGQRVAALICVRLGLCYKLHTTPVRVVVSQQLQLVFNIPADIPRVSRTVDILGMMGHICIIDLTVAVSLFPECLTAFTYNVHGILGKYHLPVGIAGFHRCDALTTGDVVQRRVHTIIPAINNFAVFGTCLSRTQHTIHHQRRAGGQRCFGGIQPDQLRQAHQISARQGFGLLGRYNAPCRK